MAVIGARGSYHEVDLVNDTVCFRLSEAGCLRWTWFIRNSPKELVQLTFVGVSGFNCTVLVRVDGTSQMIG